MTIFKIVIIFCFLFLSCQKKENHQLNLEAEKQKIRKRTQAWLKAESNKNLDSAPNIYCRGWCLSCQRLADTAGPCRNQYIFRSSVCHAVG